MKKYLPLIMPSILLLVLGFTGLIYGMGLMGIFYLDDFLTIVNNQPLKIDSLSPSSLLQAAFSHKTGPLHRPLAMMSFAVNHYFSGLDPAAFKLTNIVLHLINGALVFGLMNAVVRLYRRQRDPDFPEIHSLWLAFAVTTAWLLHPINLTGVLYVVQRMSSLATLFMLIGLWGYLIGREALLDGAAQRGYTWLALAVFMTVPAILSKETGALLLPMMLMLELTLLRGAAATVIAQRTVWIGHGLLVLLPSVFVATLLLRAPDMLLGGYENRLFDATERLLTQARVLWMYIGLILVPRPGGYSLYHDDFTLSTGLLTPWTTLPAVLGIVALIVAAGYCWRRLPLVSLGLGLFLVGHALESTIFPLEMIFEHRNYLPSLGLLLAVLTLLLHPISEQLPLRRGIAVALVVVCAGITGLRADAWGDPVRLALSEVRHHPHSARAHFELAQLYSYLSEQPGSSAEEFFQRAVQHYQQATLHDPNAVGSLSALMQLLDSRDQPIPERWIDEMAERLATRPLQPSMTIGLLQLVDCRMRQRCHLPGPLIRQLLNATRKNPTLRGESAANIAMAEAIYYTVIESNATAAIDHARRSATGGKLEHRYSLIDILLHFGHLSAAEKEIAILESQDRWSNFALRLDEKRQQLADAQERRQAMVFDHGLREAARLSPHP